VRVCVRVHVNRSKKKRKKIEVEEYFSRCQHVRTEMKPDKFCLFFIGITEATSNISIVPLTISCTRAYTVAGYGAWSCVLWCARMHTRNSRALHSADVPHINFAAVGANMYEYFGNRYTRAWNPRGNPDGMRKLLQFSGWHSKQSPERAMLSFPRTSASFFRDR